MSTLDLKLPETIKAYIEDQAIQQGYPDAGSFVTALVEEHQHRKLRSEVEALLLEAVDGPFTEWTDGDIEDIRKEGKALIDLRKGAGDSNR